MMVLKRRDVIVADGQLGASVYLVSGNKERLISNLQLGLEWVDSKDTNALLYPGWSRSWQMAAVRSVTISILLRCRSSSHK